MSWFLTLRAWHMPLIELLEEWKKGWRPPALGNWMQIREKITACLPDVSMVRPRLFRTSDVHRERSLIRQIYERSENPVFHFTINVRRGGGGDPLPTLTRLARTHGWALIDMSTGEYLDLDHPSDRGMARLQGILRSTAWRGSTCSHFKAPEERILTLCQKLASRGSSETGVDKQDRLHSPPAHPLPQPHAEREDNRQDDARDDWEVESDILGFVVDVSGRPRNPNRPRSQTTMPIATIAIPQMMISLPHLCRGWPRIVFT